MPSAAELSRIKSMAEETLKILASNIKKQKVGAEIFIGAQALDLREKIRNYFGSDSEVLW